MNNHIIVMGHPSLMDETLHLFLRAGTLQDTGNIKSLNGAPYPHNGWTSKAYQHERSKSFDKFVNDEVAVAKAMLDDSYMDKLNDAQRKRVERLKAYRKDPPESKPSQATLQGDTSHVSTNQPPRMMHESSSLTREEAGELARERNANVEKTVRKGKRSIPVRTSEKQQQDLDTRGLKSEKVRGEEESRSNQGRSRVATEHGSVEKCVNNAQLRNGSKQKLSKPTTHQKVQAKMKGQQFVPKLPETKDPRRIEQATLKDMTIPHPNAKGAVKIIGSECKTEKDNGVKHEMTMDDLSRGHIPSTDTMLSSSCSDSQESQAIGEPKDVQEANEQAGTREEETKKPSQQGGQKVLKFASKVMCRSAATSTDSHQPHKPSIDDGLEQPFGVKREQEKDTESDLAPLKRSSATTRLILHREIRDEIETLMRDSASFLSQVKNSKHSSPKRQKRRLRSASVDDSDNLNTFNASPEHSTSAYTAAHKTPTQGMSLLTRHITQGGGYTVAYVKRKASNKKRIIRVGGFLKSYNYIYNTWYPFDIAQYFILSV